MMVNRRHAKDAFAAKLERANLQNDAKRFNDENAADEEEQDFLLDDNGDDTERAAEGERTDIAHEYFCGMGVIPEKTEGRTNERAAKNGQFADARDVLNLEIVCPAIVAADVGKDGEGAGGDNSAADGETVEAVGEIDGVRRAGDDDGDENKKRQKGERPEVFRVD